MSGSSASWPLLKSFLLGEVYSTSESATRTVSPISMDSASRTARLTGRTNEADSLEGNSDVLPAVVPMRTATLIYPKTPVEGVASSISSARSSTPTVAPCRPAQ